MILEMCEVICIFLLQMFWKLTLYATTNFKVKDYRLEFLQFLAES